MVELQIVVLAVAGSSPVGHPICFFRWMPSGREPFSRSRLFPDFKSLEFFLKHSQFLKAHALKEDIFKNPDPLFCLCPLFGTPKQASFIVP